MKKLSTVVFLSNYFNHHQKPFSDAMHSRLGSGYLFIETSEMDEERKAMGWGMDAYPEYVVTRKQFLERKAFYMDAIHGADAVIIGSAPNEMVKARIRAGKLVFRYSERPLKKGLELWKYPYRFLKWHTMNPPGSNVYMLCASAYTAGDYAKFGLFRNRCFKWGYFPETKRYDDVQSLIESKRPNSLIWVARFIDWKHPEMAVELAQRLKNEGYEFELNMIGNGELWESIAESVKAKGLDDVVHLLGAMKPEQVREYMEKSQIHIFTSDRNEGWGAVLNEAMNSACVPVANRAIGSAPYLIDHGRNGFVYENMDELCDRVKCLLEHTSKRKAMAYKAHATVANEWNADEAMRCFLILCKRLLKGKKIYQQRGGHVCSNAES